MQQPRACSGDGEAHQEDSGQARAAHLPLEPPRVWRSFAWAARPACRPAPSCGTSTDAPFETWLRTALEAVSLPPGRVSHRALGLPRSHPLLRGRLLVQSLAHRRRSAGVSRTHGGHAGRWVTGVVGQPWSWDPQGQGWTRPRQAGSSQASSPWGRHPPGPPPPPAPLTRLPSRSPPGQTTQLFPRATPLAILWPSSCSLHSPLRRLWLIKHKSKQNPKP